MCENHPILFTVKDIFGTAFAFFLLAPITLIPGYVLGWWGNLFDFRERSFAVRLASSLVFGFSLTPILIYLAAKVGGFALVYAGLAILGIAAARIIRVRHFSQLPRWVVIGGFLWCIFCLVDLSDWEIGTRLYPSVIALDHSLRTAITDAISRTGVPPNNPLTTVGGFAPLRYHYFLFLFSSLASRMGGPWGDARWSVSALSIWSGLALVAMLALYLRFFDPQGPNRIQRRLKIACLLLGVTGLDLIPNLLLWNAGPPFAEMEWWNEQVTSWIGAILWVPHNIFGLIAAMTGFLLLWHAAASKRDRICHTIGAALAFASSVGLAFYVAIAFAICVTIWIIVELAGRQWAKAQWTIAAGAGAGVLVLPYLRDLSGPGRSEAPLRFAIRAFDPVRYLNLLSPLELAAANAAALPINYFLEFGFYFAVAAIGLHKALKQGRTMARHQAASMTFLLTSLVIGAVLRSGTLATNDFGWRSVLIAQFMLVLWAVDLTPSVRSRPLLAILFVIGMAGTAYEIALNRIYAMLSDASLARLFFASDRQFGERMYDERTIFEQLRRSFPSTAIIQANPIRSPDIPYGLYARRQTAASGKSCGAEMGGDPEACYTAFPEILSLFGQYISEPSRALSICRDRGIDVLVVTDLDPVWRETGSWIHRVPSVADATHAHAVFCQSASPPAFPIVR